MLTRPCTGCLTPPRVPQLPLPPRTPGHSADQATCTNRGRLHRRDGQPTTTATHVGCCWKPECPSVCLLDEAKGAGRRNHFATQALKLVFEGGGWSGLGLMGRRAMRRVRRDAYRGRVAEQILSRYQVKVYLKSDLPSFSPLTQCYGTGCPGIYSTRREESSGLDISRLTSQQLRDLRSPCLGGLPLVHPHDRVAGLTTCGV